MLLLQLTFGVAYADDAAVLLKGMWSLQPGFQYYPTITERFNRNGDPEPLGRDFNANLSSLVFTALRPLNPLVPGGLATVGRSVVTMERDITVTQFTPAYGLTDRLTVGASLSYWQVKNTISASLDTSNANVGKRVAAPAGLRPLSFPGTVPLTANDVLDIVNGGLDIDKNGTIDVPGLGFRRFETWEGEGVGDLVIAGKYQYYRSQNWRASFQGGVQFPTGRVDDPDNLADTGWSNGNYALLFALQQDFMMQAEGLDKLLGFPNRRALLVNTTFRYVANLPDKQVLRVCPVDQPICDATNKDNVRRDLGDVVDAEISARVALPITGFNVGGLGTYSHKFKDHIEGDRGKNYGALSSLTDQNTYQYIVSLTYTTIPIYVQKKFPYPLAATISYRDRFAGDNFAVKSQYIQFSIQVFLK